MLNQFQEPESGQRYDAQMQRRVVERAARLQQEDEGRQTVHQIVDAAREVGLEPYYVQRALAQVQAEQHTSAAVQTTVKKQVSYNQAEYKRFVTAMAAPMAIGAFAFAVKDVTSLAVLLSMVLPAPLACLSGFLTGRKRVGFVTAALLILALMPTAYHLGIHAYYRDNASRIYEPWFLQSARGSGISQAFGYLILGAPLAGILGAFGAWTRQRYVSHQPTVITESRVVP